MDGYTKALELPDTLESELSTRGLAQEYRKTARMAVASVYFAILNNDFFIKPPLF
jgi:hypothetical protein